MKLSKEDIDLVESIIGQSIDPLHNWDGLEIGRSAKFIPGKDAPARHVVRRVLAWRAYEKRLKALGFWGDPDVQEFVRNGIIVKKMEEADVGEVFGKLAGVAGFTNDTCQSINQSYVKHFAGDPQYALHVDTFYPHIKGWLITDPVRIEHGPLHFARGTHGISENRLRWDYACAHLPKHAGGSGGSFRVHSSADPEKESAVLKEFGLPEPKPMLANPGKMVIANTCGLHKRGRAKPGTVRTSFLAAYRVSDPFSAAP